MWYGVVEGLVEVGIRGYRWLEYIRDVGGGIRGGEVM